MNIPSLREEKKVEDHDVNDSNRIERLERLVEILCNDLFHVKEQQLRSQKQVLDLQADIAAAESAREDAERLMEQLQVRDHKVLTSLVQKQQQIEEELSSLKKLSRTSTTSMNHSPELMNLIDVTSYEDHIVDVESSDGQIYRLDDIHPDESNGDQYVLQLWEELSLSVQHLSSDLNDQRDAFEFAWTKFQLTNNQRMTVLEDANTTQMEAMKSMAIEWDTKLTELSDQVQRVNEEFTTEKASLTVTNNDMTTKIHCLGEQLEHLQTSVQRHMDYNRCINGERLVVKRDHEIQLQKLHDMVQNLNAVIHDQAEQIRSMASEQANKCHFKYSNHLAMEGDNSVSQQIVQLDKIIRIHESKVLDNVKNEVIPPREKSSLTTSLTWPTIGKDTSSSKGSIVGNIKNSMQPLSTATILKRCRSY